MSMSIPSRVSPKHTKACRDTCKLDDQSQDQNNLTRKELISTEAIGFRKAAFDFHSIKVSRARISHACLQAKS